MIIITILTFTSCDPAQLIEIVNDTESVYRFDFKDPNIIGPDTIIIGANSRDSFSVIGVFPGKSISEMKEIVSRITITRITEDGSSIIAEGKEAQSLLSKALIREDNSWKIYCSVLK